MIYDVAIFIFLFAALYSIFGHKMLVIGACVAIVYTYIQSRKEGKEGIDGTTDIEKFLEADLELVAAIKALELETYTTPFEFAYIQKQVRDFLHIYIVCFVDEVAVKTMFGDLTSLRRDLLNLIVRIDLGKLTISQAIVDEFAKCTFKYVAALVKKYDLDYKYPIPHNEYGEWDVY